MTESPPVPASEQPASQQPAPGQPLSGEPIRHFLVQAPVPVMDVDGFSATILGLIAFAVGSVVTGIFYADLERQGNGWWFGVCISGLGLGLIGMGYCLFRRGRRRAGRWTRD